jgi:hypothetical protein
MTGSQTLRDAVAGTLLAGHLHPLGIAITQDVVMAARARVS